MLTLATKFIPIRSAFETTLESGFQAAEFWLDPAVLTKADEISKLSNEFPFRYALHFPNGGDVTEETLRSTVALYEGVNATATVIHQPMFDRFGKALLEMAPELDLAIENHVLNLDQFERWADQSPGLTLDVEHLWKFTLHDAPFSTLLEHLDRFLNRYAGKLQHVHLPGYVPGEDEHHPIHFNEQLAVEVITRLAAHGFGKLVVSELASEFQTLEYLQRDVQMFDRWLASAKIPAQVTTA